MRRSPRRLPAAVALLCLTGPSALTACSDAGESASGDGPCGYRSAGGTAAELPPAEPTVTGQVSVTVATSRGPIEADLAADSAPCAVSSFLSLAEQGYFDQTPCHRLTTGGSLSVLQCGDPTGTGRGGPGYSFDDELTGEETYPAGTLAMANSGPDTNGSQFFMVYQDSELPASYTVFGTIGAQGLATVRGVAEAGVVGGGPDGSPAAPVSITSVAVG